MDENRTGTRTRPDYSAEFKAEAARRLLACKSSFPSETKVDSFIPSAIVCILWIIAIQTLPQWLVSKQAPNYYITTALTQSQWQLIQWFTVIRALGEALVVLLTVGTLKALRRSSHPWTKKAATFFLCCSWLILHAALLVLTSSIYFFLKTQNFVDANHLIALFSAPKSLFLSNVTTIQSDQLRIFLGFSVALALAFGLLLYVPVAATRKHVHILVLANLIVLVAWRSVYGLVEQESIGHFGFDSYTRYLSAPDIALVESWLERWSVQNLNEADVNKLVPIETLEEYSSRATAKTRRNFVVLVIEALRADAVTKDVMPFVTQLAEEGAHFEKFYAQSTESNYSLATIFSGLYPLKHRLRDTFSSTYYPFTRIYEVLSAQGYKTGLVIADSDEWQNLGAALRSPRLDLYFVPQNPFRDKSVIDSIGEFASGAAAEKRPFFAGAFLLGSHFPYEQQFVSHPQYLNVGLSPEEYRSMSFISYPLDLSQKMRKRYFNTLGEIDRLIEGLVVRLKSSGAWENTVLLITGDHGEFFGEYGLVNHAGVLRKEVLNVPLIVAGPNLPPLDSDGVHGHVDIAPSILAMTELPLYGNFQGNSFLLGDAEDRPPPALFATIQSVASQDAVISWPWLYVRDHRGAGDAIWPLYESGKPDEKTRRSLEGLMGEYERLQLGYYHGTHKIFELYFPPRAAYGY